MLDSRTLAQLTEVNPDHHLWANNGVWFCHYTYYPTPITKERVRVSLQTADLAIARKRRDELLIKVSMEFDLAHPKSFTRKSNALRHGERRIAV